MTLGGPSSILVTGSTGLVGGAVALQYLATTDAVLYCLTRGGTRDEARDRSVAALTTAVHAYQQHDLLAEIAHRVRGVAGDVASDPHGYDGLPRAVDLVLHAAASLKFADRDVAEINRVNVDGTANIVALAQRLNSARLCHVSTAYVAGTQQGEIDENSAPTATFNNAYEHSKLEAEKITSRSNLNFQIVRPSIVVGDSRTLAVTSFSGMYGMVDEVRRFKAKVADRLGFLLQHRGIKILADPTMPVNLIPVDYVARVIAQLSLVDTTATTFHVTNSAPPGAGMCLDAGFELLGLPRPTFVDRPEQLNELDRQLQTDFYDSYLRNGKRFSVKNTESVCGPRCLDFPIDQHMLTSLLSWYLKSGNRKGGRLT